MGLATWFFHLDAMPLAFEVVCELLDESYKSWAARKPNRPVVETWFARNATRIAAHDNDLAALLSTLLPEKRTDRVYYIQVPALENIIGRGLGLGISRRKELARHREPGSGVDLADCVHQILTITVSLLPRPRAFIAVRLTSTSRINFILTRE